MLINLLHFFAPCALCAVSNAMNSMVNSQQLFSSIVTAIKEVDEQARSSSRQSIKDIRKQNQESQGESAASAAKKIVTSSRQIPMHARLEASATKSTNAGAAAALQE